MKKLISPIVISWCLLTTSLVYGQSSVEQLNNYMVAVRGGSMDAVPHQIISDQRNAEALLANLGRYYSDTLAIVRATAYDLSKRIALNHDDKNIRQEVVLNLVEALKDKESGIVGRVASGLEYFNKGDFTQSAIDQLSSLLLSKQPHLDKIMLLVGFAGDKQNAASIMALTDDKIGRTARWSAYLAMARLGDEDALQRVLNSVKNLSLNDDVVEELLPDLIYTRQRVAFDYLIEVLNSEDKACESTDPDASTNIVCGYRVMEYLPPVIENFPIASDAGGELVTNDYEAALTEVRAWFRANPSYNIISDTF